MISEIECRGQSSDAKNCHSRVYGYFQEFLHHQSLLSSNSCPISMHFSYQKSLPACFCMDYSLTSHVHSWSCRFLQSMESETQNILLHTFLHDNWVPLQQSPLHHFDFEFLVNLWGSDNNHLLASSKLLLRIIGRLHFSRAIFYSCDIIFRSTSWSK